MGYQGWSVNLAIPIVIGVANFTMTVLTIVSRKRYLKYAIYQLSLFIVSMIPLLLLAFHIQHSWIPTVISSTIAGSTLLLTLVLCGKDLLGETIRRFHI